MSRNQRISTIRDVRVIISLNVQTQAAMVKLVDTLLLGSSASASRFESEWRQARSNTK